MGVTSKPLFVGEAPSRSTERFGGHALTGETGRRLAEWSGLSAAAFRAAADCRNVYPTLPSRWVHVRAAELARVLWNAPETQRAPLVVLLGSRVARAFGFVHAVHFEVYQTGGPAVAVMPHPSGLNRFWNDPANVALAEAFLRRVLHVTHKEPQQAAIGGLFAPMDSQ